MGESPPISVGAFKLQGGTAHPVRVWSISTGCDRQSVTGGRSLPDSRFYPQRWELFGWQLCHPVEADYFPLQNISKWVVWMIEVTGHGAISALQTLPKGEMTRGAGFCMPPASLVSQSIWGPASDSADPLLLQGTTALW